LLIDTAGSALSAGNVYIPSTFSPFEQATPGNATGQYLAAFRRYLPDGKNRTYLGLQAWSAWLLFAKAAASCGDDLTRTCVYDAGRKIHSWTGGGLHAPTDPGANASVDCFTMLRATTKGFVRMTDNAPNRGIYNCSPKNVYPMPPEFVDTTTLADVGQSLSNMK
jgi:hypothetical protein